MMDNGYPYQIYNPLGKLILSAAESCRYPKKIELSLMEAGYTIRFHGKQITQRSYPKRGNEK